MITQEKIISELSGLVGWRQSTTAGEVVINAANLASSSGLYVQGAHPMVTVKNLKNVQEDKLTITDGEMNTILTNIVNNGISNILNYLFPGNDIFTNKLLYKYESDFSTPLTVLKGFVGFEITTASRNDIISVLNKIILQFDGAGSVKLLLFHSGAKLPIETKTITVTADTDITTVLDWILGYIAAPGGKYYLGYLNKDLTIYAYDRTFGNSNIMSYFNSIVFKPIYVPDWNAETLFDINDVVYTSESFGMNLDITTAKDKSYLVLQNKNRFAKAVQLAAASEAMLLIATTVRTSVEERIVSNVFGQRFLIDSPATFNLYTLLEKELKSLSELLKSGSISSETIR